jgi:hypothetical protein
MGSSPARKIGKTQFSHDVVIFIFLKLNFPLGLFFAAVLRDDDGNSWPLLISSFISGSF